MVPERGEQRSYRKYRPYDTQRQAELTAEKFTHEKPVDKFDQDSPLTGCGDPIGGLRNRGQGGPGKRGKQDFERDSSDDKANRMEDSVGGCSVPPWGSGKDT